MKKKADEGMNRRDLLKVIGTVPAAALVPGAALAQEAGAKKSAAPAAGKTATGGYKLQILSKHEYETVKLLGDWIIPTDERSGSASQAGVPEFIDDWLNFWRGETLSEIRGGLTWLDLECNRLYGHDFTACSKEQQKTMLDRIAYPKTAAPQDSNAVAFFNRMRDLVVGGFYSSETGVKDLPYIGNMMVAHWEGCPPNVMAKIEENVRKGLELKLTKQEFGNS
jgi:Gluconate 2-dehydrogenase subunit 3